MVEQSVEQSVEQCEFDFDRGDRLALLDALPIRSGEIREGKSSVPVSGATALSVLRAIEAHGRSTGQCWASAVTIGQEIARHERTVRRAAIYLESLQFLVIDRQPGRSLRCRINWGELSLTARFTPRTPQSNPGQFDGNPGHSDANPGQCVRRSVKKRKRSLPPPVPPDPAVSVATGPVDGWSVVERDLCGLLSDWKTALREAQQSGVSAEYVAGVIEHYRTLAPRVSPGALYWRLRQSHPELPPSAGWPVEPLPAADARSDYRPDPQSILYRVVREGRKAKAADETIRRVLSERLVAAGYEADAVCF